MSTCKIHNIGKEKRLLAQDSLYWKNMNADTEEAITICSICMDFSKHNLIKIPPFKIPGKPWEIVVTDLFILNIK